ncbi:YkgJ family cysteine cluster protein [Rhodoferax sp. WC2427]|uniref:YkgJ family cysteine cluster protein n=1 Tax=Rhodoferax sp. WC2427 TaxID=3234144 RepID=UPI003465ABE9
MECRLGCGACCIAPSISSPIPGMPVVDGISKPAGVRCVQLDAANLCRIFGQPERPAVCGQLQPARDMCGSSNGHAMRYLTQLEIATRPGEPVTYLSGSPGASAGTPGR